MQRNDRRQFLANVGSGMLVGSLGAALSADLGISSVHAGEDNGRLMFGDMEPLVALMQETPLNRLQTVLMDRINGGTDLATLIAAGSLANARTFGGHDYVGFHTFMALTPALEMAAELPTGRKALPVLKVLYRNTDRIQQFGGTSSEVLKRLDASKHDGARVAAEALQQSTRKADFEGAERIMASLGSESPEKLFNHVQYPVQDDANVHRVVLAWRAWSAIGLVGEQHANTLLRQSVQFCLRSSESRIRDGKPDPELWTLLPRLLDQYKLLGKSLEIAKETINGSRNWPGLSSKATERELPMRRLRHWQMDTRLIKLPKRCQSRPICYYCMTRGGPKMVTVTKSKGRFMVHRSAFTHRTQPTPGVISRGSAIIATQSQVYWLEPITPQAKARTCNASDGR